MRYFKITEISEEEYESVCEACPEWLLQDSTNVDGYVYVAINDEELDGFEVGLDMLND